MLSESLFISYGHGDMRPVNWLERLKLYLAPFRRQNVVDVWDDTRIDAGAQWRQEIAQALDRTTSSILLVGPAFLASAFIAENELPDLLKAAKGRGVSIYPLVIKYCAYKRSVLEPYQAFNDPDLPLEALQEYEQNKILNDLSLKVDQDLRRVALSARAVAELVADTRRVLTRIAQELDMTDIAFNAQRQKADLLANSLKGRLKISEHLEYEDLFFLYFNQLNDQEKFQFDQIRAMTEGPLHDGNLAILRIIEANPQLLEEVPTLAALRQHLVFWLNKYDKIFIKRPEMCLVYVGVEDGVPFPRKAQEDVKIWLSNHQ